MRLRSTILNIAIVAVSVVVSLIAAEIGLRLVDGVSLASYPNFVRQRVDMLAVHTMAKYDPTVGWTIAPNVRSKSERQSFTTDELGTRQPSAEPRPLPKGGILAVGDSFTAGSEVSDEESWPAILEKMLDIPVVNSAAGAWGSDQIVLQAERMIGIAQPRTIVVSFFWQDILRAEYRIYGGAHKPYFLPSKDTVELRNSPVPHFTGNSREIGNLRWALGHSYLAFWLAPRVGYANWVSSWDLQYKRASPDGTGIEISCQLLRRLKATTDKAGIRLLFLMQYGSNDFDLAAPPAHAARVSMCAQGAAIQTVDPWAKMKQMFDRNRQALQNLFVLQKDGKTRGHMSESGNRFIATEVAAVLKAPR
jgi:lysophospholipase L1-like esterase